MDKNVLFIVSYNLGLEYLLFCKYLAETHEVLQAKCALFLPDVFQQNFQLSKFTPPVQGFRADT
jgi:hypothetical protein